MRNLYTTKDGYNVAIIDNNSIRPSKLTNQNFFLDALVKDIDNIAIMEDLMKAVVDGDLLPADVDVIINKAHAKRMAKLLVGFDNTVVHYNHNYGVSMRKNPRLDGAVMRDERDYFKSLRWYVFQNKVGRRGAYHYYTNVHHWRLREWHGVPKLYSS